MTEIEAAFIAFLKSHTLQAAQELEVVLDEAYPDDPLVQECVSALASYRPDGGDLLFDSIQIGPFMDRLKSHLRFGSVGA